MTANNLAASGQDVTGDPARRWLPFGPPTGDGRAQPAKLFCFPHSGAGAASYARWRRSARDRIVVCPVQPPGRAERYKETPYRNMVSYVDDLVRDVGPHFTGTYALYGHSVGALVAFEVARRLRAVGAEPPAHLFVSGRTAPHAPSGRVPLGSRTDDSLVAELRRMGGTPDMFLDEPELLAMFLPVLRADLAVNDQYRYRDEEPLPIPVTAFGGRTDPQVTEAELRMWAEQTSSRFTLRMFPGGHFFVEPHAGELVDLVCAALPS